MLGQFADLGGLYKKEGGGVFEGFDTPLHTMDHLLMQSFLLTIVSCFSVIGCTVAGVLNMYDLLVDTRHERVNNNDV